MLSFDVHQNLLGNFLKVQRSRPYQISKSWRLYILLEQIYVGESLPDTAHAWNQDNQSRIPKSPSANVHQNQVNA